MKILILLICLIFVSLGYAQIEDPNSLMQLFFNEEYDALYSRLHETLPGDPDNRSLRFLLGKTCLAMNYHAEAVNEFKQALENTPSDAPIHSLIGRSFQERGMTAEAIDAYESAIQADTTFKTPWIKLASLYFKKHDYESVITKLKGYLKIDSMNAQAMYLLGRAYLRTTRYDSVIATASAAVARDSLDFPNRLNLGVAHFHQEHFKEAMTVLKEAVALSPNAHEAVFYLAQTQLQMNHFYDAIHSLEACMASVNPYRVRAYKALLKLYYDMTLHHECIRIAEEFITTFNIDDPTVYYYLGRALSDAQRFGEAKEYLHKALVHSNGEFIQSIFFFQGLNAYMEKNYAVAIQMYKRALSIDPEDVYTIHNLAVAYDDYYDEKNTAIQYYEKLFSIDTAPIHAPILKAAKDRISTIKELDFFKEGKNEAQSASRN